MSKQDNLKDYLTDLYEGISLRNPGASRNPQDFRTEIENIEGGDGAPIYDGTIEIDGQPADDYTDYYEKGLEDGEAIGRQAQHDEFWDSVKDDTNWGYRFCGSNWNTTTFKPNFDLNLKGNCNFCFANNIIKVDLVEWLSELGITMSTTEMTQCSKLFYYAKFTRLGVIDLSKVVSANETFAYMEHLHTIDKVIILASFSFSDTFASTPNLVNLTIEGTIGQAGLNLRWSPKLSKASIASIINSLSSTTSGLSVTLSKTAVNTAFETASGLADGSVSDEWLNLIAQKNNWTVSLV